MHTEKFCDKICDKIWTTVVKLSYQRTCIFFLVIGKKKVKVGKIKAVFASYKSALCWNYW